MDINNDSSSVEVQTPLLSALIAGAAAGIAVDLTLFPLDTVKTRLQSEHGFFKSGGFRGIYSGLSSAMLGSAPTSATFFLTYEGVKQVWSAESGGRWEGVGHMLAASAGETMACVVRVPVEVIKQRAQASRHRVSHIFMQCLRDEGVLGLYRGFTTTVSREIPFSLLQFPLWEALKNWITHYQGRPCSPGESALSGAVAGACAALATTPLDVCKTRIMLAPHGTTHATASTLYVMRDVWREGGWRALFAGCLPRTLMISIGGFIFLGTYDATKEIIKNL